MTACAKSGQKFDVVAYEESSLAGLIELREFAVAQNVSQLFFGLQLPSPPSRHAGWLQALLADGYQVHANVPADGAELSKLMNVSGFGIPSFMKLSVIRSTRG